MLCFPALCSAQGFYKLFGGPEADVAYDAIESKFGGYIAVGSTNSYGVGSSDFYVVRTDSIGELLWQQTVGDIKYENAKSVAEGPAGEIYVVGETLSKYMTISYRDIYLAKFSADGQLLWTETYGDTLDDYGSSVVTVGNDVVVSGTTSSYNGQSIVTDIYLFKVDSAGTLIWEKNIGGLTDEVGMGLTKVHDGGFLVSGSYKTISTRAGYAVRTDAQGDSIWAKLYHASGQSYAGFEQCTELEGDSLFATGGRFGSSYSTYLANVINLDGEVTGLFMQSGYLRYVTDFAPGNDGGFVAIGYPFTHFDHKCVRVSENSLITGTSVAKVSDQGYLTSGLGQKFGNTSVSDLMISKTNSGGFPATNSNAIAVEIHGNPPYCTSDSLILSVPDGFDHYQWYYADGIWHYVIDGANNDSLLVDTLGNYFCLMTIGTEVVVASAASVFMREIPTAVLNYSDTLSFCKSDTTIKIQTNTIGYTTYQWHFNGGSIPGATDNDLTPDSTGYYYVESTNDCGMARSDSLWVNVNAPPNYIPVVPDSGFIDYNLLTGFECAPSSLSFSTTYSTSYSYQWYLNGQPLPSVGYSTGVHEAGQLYAVVSNSCGSSASNTANIYADTLQNVDFKITSNGPLQGCGPLNIYLSVNYLPNHKYQWFRNSLPVNGTAASYSPNGPGDYHCMISKICGIDTTTVYSDTVAFSYERKYGYQIIPSGSIPVACGTDSILLNISNSSAIHYQWYRDNAPIPGNNATSMYATLSGLYYCKYVFAGCDTVTSYYTYVRIGLPVSSVIFKDDEDTVMCWSGQKVYLELTYPDHSSMIDSVQWLFNGVEIPNAIGNYYNASQPGYYSCRVFNICGSSISDSVYLNLNTDSATISGIQPQFCEGDTITLTAVAPNAVTYQWYHSNQPQLITDSILQVTEPGYIKVYVNNGYCSYNSPGYVMEVQDPPITGIMPVNYPYLCGIDSVKVVAPNRYDLSYQWYKDNQMLPGQNQHQYYATAEGTYEVMMTDSIGCFFHSDQLDIKDSTYTNFAIYSSANSNVVCNGDTMTLFAGINASSYQWYYNLDSIPGATSDNIKVVDQGLYSVRTSSGNGCSGIASISIFESSLDSTATITPESCMDGNGAIYVGYNGLANYMWSNGTTSGYNQNLSSGTYTVTVSSYVGCVDIFTYFVPVTNLYQPSINGDSILCHNDSTYLNAGYGYDNYLWSTGETTQLIWVDTTGVFSVVVTDSTGQCTGSDSVNVSFSPDPNLSITPNGTTKICIGDSVLLSATPGYSKYDWYHNGALIQGNTSSSIWASARGSYYFTINDVHGCEHKSPKIIVRIVCIYKDPDDLKFTIDETVDWHVSIHPNPTNGVFQMVSDCSKDENMNLKIYNTSGKLIRAFDQISTEYRVDLSAFPEGVYTAEVVCGNQKKHLKVVKLQ